MMVDAVLTRDYRSGKVHRRYVTEGGALASLEADNLDDAGPYEIIDPDAQHNAAAADMCQRCFPPDPVPA
jgi:methylmalonyl-CoA mutase cobalamin-binding subunit